MAGSTSQNQSILMLSENGLAITLGELLFLQTVDIASVGFSSQAI